MKIAINNDKSTLLYYLTRIINLLWWKRKIVLLCTKKNQKHILLQLNNMQQGQLDGLLEYRSKKLIEILKYANKHCPYYQKQFKKNNFNLDENFNFKLLPLLDKTIIRKNFSDIISCELERLDYYTMNTGGSTGEPLEFPVSPNLDRVHQEFHYGIMGYKPGDKIVAFDGVTVPEELLKKNIYWISTGKDIPYGRLSYSSLYLRKDTIPYYVRHILDTKPTILRGYPSFINDIAEYFIENDISIPFQVKGVQLTAENAYEWQIKNIKQAFNTEVFLQYGHSEVCVYGYTFDSAHEYYCSPFYGFTEVLGDDGLHVNLGEVGEVVVTGFYNYAMPFIRYRTGDLALFNGDTNGIIRLGKIVGRTQDCIFTSNGEKVALTALIFGQHYHSFGNIQKWQLQQDIPGKVKVRIVKGEGFLEEDEIEIRAKFKDVCDVATEFEYLNQIPLTARGKFRFLIQNLQV